MIELEKFLSPDDSEALENLCIICRKNEVSWPRVCNDCQDKEAQEELSLKYIDEGIRHYEVDPYDDGKDEVEGGWIGGECKTCGMLYDGGMRCTYCGDTDPWDYGEEDLE